MCVAGATVDSDAPRWVRLHPVPFRDLDEGSKFKKYQEVTIAVRRSTTDRRPESWEPVHGSIKLGPIIGTDDGWAHRRRLIDQLGEASMCDLVEMNRSGSGPGTPSLGVVRPRETPTLEITKRDQDQLDKWNSYAEAAANRRSLFDDPEVQRPRFEVIPWRFRYHYRCRNMGCKGHQQTVVDWEVAALWRKVRWNQNWREMIRSKFEQDLWDGKDSVLFVGNQEQRPWGFLVLGVFWPPAGAVQGVLGY